MLANFLMLSLALLLAWWTPASALECTTQIQTLPNGKWLTCTVCCIPAWRICVALGISVDALIGVPDFRMRDEGTTFERERP